MEDMAPLHGARAVALWTVVMPLGTLGRAKALKRLDEETAEYEWGGPPQALRDHLTATVSPPHRRVGRRSLSAPRPGPGEGCSVPFRKAFVAAVFDSADPIPSGHRTQPVQFAADGIPQLIVLRAEL
ncbi:hypothetical protein [Streptomyces sp. URMC 123]|uniref:hypothetical protein n=1 Tax=Streptomyces sp. URMC 123 TaxID=3423403 RepID=UPI003F1A5584